MRHLRTLIGCYSVTVGMLAVALTLAACGSGGDGGTPPVAVPLTGKFIDSPVQGLPYSSAPSGLAGVTGPNGEFSYQPGDSVTFNFGAQIIGIALGQPHITPFTLLARTAVPDVRHEWPVNLAQLLLGLDTVPGTDTITLPATLPTLPGAACFSCPNFDAEVIAAGITLATEADAIAHLQRQFAIWGSWATVNTPSELQVITFLPDGTYLLAHDNDPAVLGGIDGMERGTYQWSAATNGFTYTVAVNTDGTGGLSNPDPNQTPPYTFVIDPTGTTAVLHFGPNISDEIPLTRVTDATKLFVGGWRLQAPISDFFTVLTLMSDGTFTVASDAIDTAPAGMERGTYVVDTTTGNVTLTTTVDTDGAFGVNDSPTLPATTVVKAQIGTAIGFDPDFLSVDDGTGVVFFNRIKVP